MSSYYIRTASLLLMVVLLTYSCTEPSLSDVRIERFEKLDEQPYRQCYLVYGYHPSIEREIGLMLDKFVCDSIFPYFVDYQANNYQGKLFLFYKKTKNANNKETYLSDMKRAIADRDIIFEYLFKGHGDSTLMAPTRKIYKVNDPDMVIEPFNCE